MNPLAYVKLAAAGAVAIALVSTYLYIGHLQSARDQALAANAALQATNNELTAVHANDVKALAELEAAKAQSEAALLADARQQQIVTQTVTLWKEKVVHVPVASTCRAADARDAATLDGLRHILATATAADSDEGGKDPPAGRPVGGHPAAGPPAAARNP